MNNQHFFKETLKTIEQQILEHNKQLKVLDIFAKLLSALNFDYNGIRRSMTNLKFHVHYGRPAHNKEPIRVSSDKLSDAYIEAKRLFEKCNGCKPSTLAEAFVCYEEMTMPILPNDAAQIASLESNETFTSEMFCVSPWTIEDVGVTVRGVDDQLSSLHVISVSEKRNKTGIGPNG